MLYCRPIYNINCNTLIYSFNFSKLKIKYRPYCTILHIMDKVARMDKVSKINMYLCVASS